MLNTTRPAISSFFILSASLSEVVDTKISKLSFIGRQAYYAHDYNRLAVIGNELMNLSARSEDVGRYFHSIAEHRLGLKGFDETVFEELANQSSAPVRAASIHALGLQALRYRKTDEALRLFLESYNLSVTNNRSSIIGIHAANSVSELFSINGSHGESLKLLRAIHPAVCEWGRVYPLLLGEQFNNVAYELFKLGELSAAQYTINKACAMPIAKLNPEWFETKAEIEDKLREKKSPSLVAVAEVRKECAAIRDRNNPAIKGQPEPQRENNVVSFKRKKIELWLKYRNYTHFLHQFAFDGDTAVEDFLVNLLDGIDELREGESASTLTIHTQLLENHEVRYETENFIARSNFNELFVHFDEMKILLEVLAGAASEEADENTVKEQTEKIMQLLEADDESSGIM